MAKKAAKSTPDIYVGLIKDPKLMRQCIIEDNQAQFFRFNTAAENHIVENGIAKKFDNFDKFLEQNEQTILAYHENLFGKEPPKDQDRVTTAALCWYKICATAADRTNKTPKDPTTGRKSTILTRKYYLGTNTNNDGIKTPQALACIRILKDTIEKEGEHDNPEDLSTPRFIQEAKFKQAIIDRAGELHTRQDPWRIFQYYRATLIKAHVIRCD